MKKSSTIYQPQINDSLVVTHVKPPAVTGKKEPEVTHTLIPQRELANIVQHPLQAGTYNQRLQDTIKAREVLLGIKLMLSNRPE